MDQCFVAGRLLVCKIIIVSEIHLDRPQPRRVPGYLGIEVHPDTLVGLQSQYQGIGRYVGAFYQ